MDRTAPRSSSRSGRSAARRPRQVAGPAWTSRAVRAGAEPAKALTTGWTAPSAPRAVQVQ
ncbi:MAG TPA: hypothetical protein VFS70_16505 [Actinomycetota bacterium]|nr:hypothetical protein [Actinomycetota bacterium]